MTLDELIDALTYTEAGCGEDALADFERKVGAALPAGYRQFLARCNGGFSRGRLGVDPSPGLSLDFGICPDHFGGIGRGEVFSLDAMNAMFGRRPSDSWLCIVSDSMGNGLTLELKGSDRGSVFLFDGGQGAEVGEALGRRAGARMKFANSFLELVGNIAELSGDERWW
ncbi:SMI1/KNR4 family protein [Planctomycetes bacterium Pla163]|jgi:hypothetical protein|uniref:SMI1/KNR4 family protein n=1 Tax=Rohdeia mirabilis TaxID=2528008 RepID=UPI0011A4D94B